MLYNCTFMNMKITEKIFRKELEQLRVGERQSLTVVYLREHIAHAIRSQNKIRYPYKELHNSVISALTHLDDDKKTHIIVELETEGRDFVLYRRVFSFEWFEPTKERLMEAFKKALEYVNNEQINERREQ